MSHPPLPTPSRSPAKVVGFTLLVTGASLCAVVAVTAALPWLLLPGVLLGSAYVVPAGDVRLVLQTLASIALALAAAAGALLLLFVLTFAGAQIG